ncbi:glycosyltransferase [bacterium]|nr:MAG: glycosyltransferase [bacterium]
MKIDNYNKSSPLISIITVSYNAGRSVEKTIQSVVNQSYSTWEYIIIDGGSTDNTVELIQKYEQPNVRWVSEPDLGIYNAMNKGINMSKGDWVIFLGADDQLSPDILLKIHAYLGSQYYAVFGKVQFDNGHVMQSYFGLRIFLQNTVHHQSVFYKRGLFDEFMYDESYRAISDYELNLMIRKNKLDYKKIDEIISYCSSNGTSSEFNLSLSETNKIRAKVIRNPFVNYLLSSFLYMYYLQKKIRGVSLVGSSKK